MARVEGADLVGTVLKSPFRGTYRSPVLMCRMPPNDFSPRETLLMMTGLLNAGFQTL